MSDSQDYSHTSNHEKSQAQPDQPMSHQASQFHVTGNQVSAGAGEAIVDVGNPVGSAQSRTTAGKRRASPIHSTVSHKRHAHDLRNIAVIHNESGRTQGDDSVRNNRNDDNNDNNNNNKLMNCNKLMNNNKKNNRNSVTSCANDRAQGGDDNNNTAITTNNNNKTKKNSNSIVTDSADEGPEGYDAILDELLDVVPADSYLWGGLFSKFKDVDNPRKCAVAIARTLNSDLRRRSRKPMMRWVEVEEKRLAKLVHTETVTNSVDLAMTDSADQPVTYSADLAVTSSADQSVTNPTEELRNVDSKEGLTMHTDVVSTKSDDSHSHSPPPLSASVLPQLASSCAARDSEKSPSVSVPPILTPALTSLCATAEAKVPDRVVNIKVESPKSVTDTHCGNNAQPVSFLSAPHGSSQLPHFQFSSGTNGTHRVPPHLPPPRGANNSQQFRHLPFSNGVPNVESGSNRLLPHLLHSGGANNSQQLRHLPFSNGVSHDASSSNQLRHVSANGSLPFSFTGGSQQFASGSQQLANGSQQFPPWLFPGGIGCSQHVQREQRQASQLAWARGQALLHQAYQPHRRQDNGTDEHRAKHQRYAYGQSPHSHFSTSPHFRTSTSPMPLPSLLSLSSFPSSSSFLSPLAAAVAAQAAASRATYQAPPPQQGSAASRATAAVPHIMQAGVQRTEEDEVIGTVVDVLLSINGKCKGKKRTNSRSVTGVVSEKGNDVGGIKKGGGGGGGRDTQKARSAKRIAQAASTSTVTLATFGNASAGPSSTVTRNTKPSSAASATTVTHEILRTSGSAVSGKVTRKTKASLASSAVARKAKSSTGTVTLATFTPATATATTTDANGTLTSKAAGTSAAASSLVAHKTENVDPMKTSTAATVMSLNDALAPEIKTCDTGSSATSRVVKNWDVCAAAAAASSLLDRRTMMASPTATVNGAGPSKVSDVKPKARSSTSSARKPTSRAARSNATTVAAGLGNVVMCAYANGCQREAKLYGLCNQHGGVVKHRCKHPDGCDKLPQRFGLCKAHGGRTNCSRPGCMKSETTRGLCTSHGGGNRCRHPGGCMKLPQRKGLCLSHGGVRRCKHAGGCQKHAKFKGFCIAHGGGKRCSHTSGCDKSIESNNLCCAHGGGRRCKLDGCEKLRKSKGFCKPHARAAAQRAIALVV